MWLNLMMVTSCGLGSMATVWIRMSGILRLNILQTVCYAVLFLTSVANVRGTPLGLLSPAINDVAMVVVCSVLSFCSGYTRTWICAHVGDVPQPAGATARGEEATAHLESVSRKSSVAWQLGALSAALVNFVLGPILGFFPV